MPSWNRSVRTRLTAGVLLIFALVCALAGVFTDRQRARDFRAALDERLRDVCLSLAETVRVDEQGVSFPAAPSGRPPRYSGLYWQIGSGPDRILMRSTNLGAAALPWPAGGDGLPGAAETRTLRGLGSGPIEIRTLHVVRPGSGDGSGLVVQAAADTSAMRRSLARLRRVLLLAGLAGLVGAGLLCWLLTGRVVAPLAELAERSAGFSPRDRWEPLGPAGEDEVGVLVRAIDTMGARAAATVQAQERFVADASHELKTPLAVVLAEAQVLRQQPRSVEEYRAFVATVEEELVQLVYLVESLLTLARAHGGVPCSFRPVAVNEVLMEALEQFGPRARDGDVRLAATLVPPGPDDQDALVSGDPQLLRVLLQNLLRNAIRYSPAGRPVEVSARLDGSEVELCVRDHGPGIPTDALRQVFEPFFRMPDSEQWGEGVGLGLTLVREITHLHGGTVQAANHPDGGAEFRVRLPRTK